MDINEIAKEMTREEFINEYTTCEYCPKDYNLKEHEDCGKGGTCHKCWKNAIKDIKFKGENDMDREYSIGEVLKFPLGTEFIANGLEMRLEERNNQKVLYTFGTGGNLLSISDFWINEKYKLVKKDKEVPFLEAVKAYHKGETIYCILETTKFIYRGCSGDANFMLDEKSKCSVSAVEILEGKWFIKA